MSSTLQDDSDASSLASPASLVSLNSDGSTGGAAVDKAATPAVVPEAAINGAQQGTPTQEVKHGLNGALVKPRPFVKRHPRFYMQEENVELLIENTMYSVHGYFLRRDSPFFRLLFAAQPSTPRHVELRDLRATYHAEGAIELNYVYSLDFERLLSILYPTNFQAHPFVTVAEWASVLHLAHAWGLQSIRSLAVDNLSTIAAPVDKVILGKYYGISDWLLDAYVAICGRLEPPSLEEGRHLGADDLVRLSSAREGVLRGEIADGAQLRAYVESEFDFSTRSAAQGSVKKSVRLAAWMQNCEYRAREERTEAQEQDKSSSKEAQRARKDDRREQSAASLPSVGGTKRAARFAWGVDSDSNDEDDDTQGPAAQTATPSVSALTLLQSVAAEVSSLEKGEEPTLEGLNNAEAAEEPKEELAEASQSSMIPANDESKPTIGAAEDAKAAADDKGEAAEVALPSAKLSLGSSLAEQSQDFRKALESLPPFSRRLGARQPLTPTDGRPVRNTHTDTHATSAYTTAGEESSEGSGASTPANLFTYDPVTMQTSGAGRKIKKLRQQRR